MLHQMIYKSTSLRNFSCFTILTAKSEKQTYFVTTYSTIFRIKEVIWSQKKIIWSKYNTLPPENYYFLDTIKWLGVSQLLESTLNVTSATKRYFLKMRHLGHTLRIFLFRGNIMFRSQIFKFFYLKLFHDLANLWRHDEY